MQNRIATLLVLAASATALALPATGAPPPEAPHAWALEYEFARPVLVTNGGGALEDYPVLVRVDSGALVAAGKMRADCADVRFADAGGRLLPHWLERGCGSNATRFFVKVPAIPARGLGADAPDVPVDGTTLLVLYHGNAAAADASDGAAVLDVFETFDDLDGWSNVEFELYQSPRPLRESYPPAVVDARGGNGSPSARRGPEGGPSPTAMGHLGIAREVALPGNVDLVVALDARARSSFSGSTVTNAFVRLHEGSGVAGPRLASHFLALGGTFDTGWVSHDDVPVFEARGATNVTLYLGTHDAWVDGHARTVWFDNVAARRVATPEPVARLLDEVPLPASRLTGAP